MKATAALKVPDDAQVQLTLFLSVAEMRSLLKATTDVHAWPVGSLRSVLQQALQKADQAYHSEHAIEP